MYKTAREVFEALLAGKKLRHDMWEPGEYVYLKNDKVVSNDDVEVLNFQPNLFESWYEYIEPKKIKIYEVQLIENCQSFLVSASSKKEARKSVYNFLLEYFPLETAKAALSIRHASCKRFKFEKNSTVVELW